jgi:GNAT superfamily N-acetyltransferase
MASIDEPAIGPLGAHDLGAALALTAEAGWNQTGEDWAFFLAHATVHAARDVSGRLVATAAVLAYPGNSAGEPGFAWVSLVIVTASQRGRGLGTRMLQQCIAELRSRSLSGLLDATPAGERVYTPLGFEPVLGLQRWRGQGGGARGFSAPGQPLDRGGLARVGGLDACAFGARRSALLGDFLGRAGTRGFELADRGGYAMVRCGRVASHLGPVVAANAPDAIALIDVATAATSGPLVVDVPDTQTELAAWLGAHGFSVERPLLRMVLGRAAPVGDPTRVFAIAGPEYG